LLLFAVDAEVDVDAGIISPNGEPSANINGIIEAMRSGEATTAGAEDSRGARVGDNESNGVSVVVEVGPGVEHESDFGSSCSSTTTITIIRTDEPGPVEVEVESELRAGADGGATADGGAEKSDVTAAAPVDNEEQRSLDEVGSAGIGDDAAIGHCGGDGEEADGDGKDEGVLAPIVDTGGREAPVVDSATCGSGENGPTAVVVAGGGEGRPTIAAEGGATTSGAAATSQEEAEVTAMDCVTATALEVTEKSPAEELLNLPPNDHESLPPNDDESMPPDDDESMPPNDRHEVTLPPRYDVSFPRRVDHEKNLPQPNEDHECIPQRNDEGGVTLYNNHEVILPRNNNQESVPSNEDNDETVPAGAAPAAEEPPTKRTKLGDAGWIGKPPEILKGAIVDNKSIEEVHMPPSLPALAPPATGRLPTQPAPRPKRSCTQLRFGAKLPPKMPATKRKHAPSPAAARQAQATDGEGQGGDKVAKGNDGPSAGTSCRAVGAHNSNNPLAGSLICDAILFDDEENGEQGELCDDSATTCPTPTFREIREHVAQILLSPGARGKLRALNKKELEKEKRAMNTLFEKEALTKKANAKKARDKKEALAEVALAEKALRKLEAHRSCMEISGGRFEVFLGTLH
jgi:hypothetical protein